MCARGHNILMRERSRLDLDPRDDPGTWRSRDRRSRNGMEIRKLVLTRAHGGSQTAPITRGIFSARTRRSGPQNPAPAAGSGPLGAPAGRTGGAGHAGTFPAGSVELLQLAPPICCRSVARARQKDRPAVGLVVFCQSVALIRGRRCFVINIFYNATGLHIQ